MTTVSGGTTTTGSIARQLEMGINAVVGQNYPQYPKQYTDFLEVVSSKKAYETDVPMAGTGYAKATAEGAGVEFDSMQEGAAKRYLNVKYALAFRVTEEAIEDNLYAPMIPKIGRMGVQAIAHTKEEVAANMINNGYNSSYVGWDGLSLFNSAHKLIKGGTYSNVLPVAADLSEASLEDAIIRIQSLTDDAGLLIGLTAQSLHVAPSNQFNAERILKSTLQNDTNNNAINAIRSNGMLPKGYFVNQRFDDAANWFIRTDCMDGGKFINRVDIKSNNDNDFGTGDYLHKVSTRFAVGWTDARQYFGSGNVV